MPRMAAAADDGVRRRLALLVGISEYDQSGPTPWGRLHGAQDVDRLREVLRSKRFGFNDDEIMVLKDREATTQRIRDAFQHHLIDKAGPGTVAIFHFSGHGQQIEDDGDDELDGLDESLVTFDARSRDAKLGVKTNLRDDELGKLLGALRSRMLRQERMEGSITVFLDTCFSGTGTRGRLAARGKGWDPDIDGRHRPGNPLKKPKGTTQIMAQGEVRDADYVFMAASDSQQQALELGGSGVFTNALIKALGQLPAQATYRTLFDIVTLDVTSRVHDQTPQAEGDLSQPLFGFPEVVRPVEPFLRVHKAGSDWVIIPTGYLGGTTVDSRFALFPPVAPDGEDKPVATAIIKSVAETTSVAKIVSSSLALRPERPLEGYRAREVAHAYEMRRLKVLLREMPPEIQAALRALPIVLTEKVSEQDYDLIIRQSGDQIEVLRMDSDRPFVKVTMEGFVQARLEEVLQREWLREHIVRLVNPSPLLSGELFVAPVKVDLNKDRRVISTQLSLTPDFTEAGRLILREGEYFQIATVNKGLDPVYIYVLGIEPDGRVLPIFPHPEAHGRCGDNLLAADGVRHWVPIPCVYRVERSRCPGGGPLPPGPRLLKMIMTTKRTDLTFLLHDGCLATRQQVPAAPEATDSPLRQLFLKLSRGQRDDPPVLDTISWVTAERWYEIRP